MLWLDHLIFGSGYGLCSPYFDNTFYWLVDTSNGRKGEKGRLYTYSDGLGAQLRSIEWRTPKPGTRRQLAGVTFTVFSTSRRGPRVEVTWSMRLPDNIDLANAKLREFRERLGGYLLGVWPPEGRDTLDSETARPAPSPVTESSGCGTDKAEEPVLRKVIVGFDPASGPDKAVWFCPMCQRSGELEDMRQPSKD